MKGMTNAQKDVSDLATKGELALKADQSALDSTNTEVAKKANQSDLTALQTTVEGKADDSNLIPKTNGEAGQVWTSDGSGAGNWQDANNSIKFVGCQIKNYTYRDLGSTNLRFDDPVYANCYIISPPTAINSTELKSVVDFYTGTANMTCVPTISFTSTEDPKNAVRAKQYDPDDIFTSEIAIRMVQDQMQFIGNGTIKVQVTLVLYINNTLYCCIYRTVTVTVKNAKATYTCSGPVYYQSYFTADLSLSTYTASQRAYITKIYT